VTFLPSTFGFAHLALPESTLGSTTTVPFLEPLWDFKLGKSVGGLAGLLFPVGR
jgi:hypothetical protein